MSNPTPRDPLTNQTLRVPESERVESAVPAAYRLGMRNGGYVLQGSYKSWNAQGMIFHEWRDIETVEL